MTVYGKSDNINSYLGDDKFRNGDCIPKSDVMRQIGVAWLHKQKIFAIFKHGAVIVDINGKFVSTYVSAYNIINNDLRNKNLH